MFVGEEKMDFSVAGVTRGADEDEVDEEEVGLTILRRRYPLFSRIRTHVVRSDIRQRRFHVKSSLTSKYQCLETCDALAKVTGSST